MIEPSHGPTLRDMYMVRALRILPAASALSMKRSTTTRRRRDFHVLVVAPTKAKLRLSSSRISVNAN